MCGDLPLEDWASFESISMLSSPESHFIEIEGLPEKMQCLCE